MTLIRGKRNVKTKAGMFAVALAAAAVVGCGGSDESNSEEKEAQATPQQAIAEIGEVRTGIDEALKTYAAGDAAKAVEQVGDAYLQHFELVEGPLEKADEELNEKLEDAIREELRGKISDEAPKSEVQQLADAIKADLTKAEAALK
jgi:hypothetical protein